MTRDELRCAANKYAEEIGAPSVTDRHLRDWRDEGLLSGPKGRGRGRGQGVDWDWPDEALANIKTIIRLRGMGERRATQFRAYLWIAGADIPFAKAKEAICAEFERSLKDQRRMVPGEPGRDTKSSWASVLRRLGPLDPDLEPFAPFELSEDGSLFSREMLAEFMGTEGAEFATLERLKASWPELIEFDNDHFVQNFFSGFTGIFGVPDETASSAIELLKSATETEFADAREIASAIYLGWLAATALVTGADDPLASKWRTVDRSGFAVWIFVCALNGLKKTQGDPHPV